MGFDGAQTGGVFLSVFRDHLTRSRIPSAILMHKMPLYVLKIDHELKFTKAEATQLFMDNGYAASGLPHAAFKRVAHSC